MTVAMDAMAVAIHIKYALSLNEHFTYYWRVYCMHPRSMHRLPKTR